MEQCITESDFYAARWKLISKVGTSLLTWTFKEGLAENYVIQGAGKELNFSSFFPDLNTNKANKLLFIFTLRHLQW